MPARFAARKDFPIRIKHVGRAEDSVEEPRGLSRLDGLNAVSLFVQRQSGTNTVAISDFVQQRLGPLMLDKPNFVAGAMFYLRHTTITDLDKQCGSDRQACPESQRSAVDRGKLYTTLGDVTLAAGSSVWFNAVIRGDNAPISIGVNSNIQECSVLHTDTGVPLVVGANVTVGHQVHRPQF